MSMRLKFHSLRAQIISSSILLVLLTAIITGLPALWIIRDQLDHQAWAQIDQGYRSAQALYQSRERQLSGLAKIIAQRPALKETLQQGDMPVLENYLSTLQASEKIDLIAICGLDQLIAVSTVSGQAPD